MTTAADPKLPRCKRNYQLPYCRGKPGFRIPPETCALFERLELKLPLAQPKAPPVVEVRAGNERALGAVIGERIVLTAEPVEGRNARNMEVRTLHGRRISVATVTLHPDASLALVRLTASAIGNDVSQAGYYQKDASALGGEQALELFGFDAATGALKSQKLPPRLAVYRDWSNELQLQDVEPASLRVPQGAPLLTVDGQLVAMKTKDAKQTIVTAEEPNIPCEIYALFYILVPLWQTAGAP